MIIIWISKSSPLLFRNSWPDPLHGRVGTPTVWATMVDAILSPRAHMADAGGPEEIIQIAWIILFHN